MVGICNPGFAADSESPKKVVEIAIRSIDPAAAAKVSYARQIRPLLDEKCGDCHNADDRKGEFETTSVANLLKKGKKAGPGVVAKQPDESAIVQYIRGLKTPQMPKGDPVLTEEQLHLIRMWISAGAADDSGGVALAPTSRSSTRRPTTTHVSSLARTILDPKFNTSKDKDEVLAKWREERIAKLPPTPTPPPIPESGATFNAIDQFILAKWEPALRSKAGLGLCDDSVFVRRVFLDVIGVIPTSAEAKRFVEDKSPDKRVTLVEELLARNADYAANWTPFWEEALGSNVSVGGIVAHTNYHDWIVRTFEQNKPYDQMVVELVDPSLAANSQAKAKKQPGGPNDYVLKGNHNATLVTAANTAQVFLGTSMKCASCHNHFLNTEWPQSRFLAFAGLFADKDVELIRCEKSSGKYVPARFPFDLPELPADAATASRLQLLTLSLVDPCNGRFAKTIVNRLWKRYLGLGLIEPADDYREDTPPSHPELLEWLAQDFIRNGYDLKHTTRLILTSRTYQMRFDPALDDKFDVAKPGAQRYFRSPSLRRLTAEQTIDSVRMGVTQKLDRKDRIYASNASTALTRALGRPSSRSEISTGRSDDAAVVQSLELLNGTEIQNLVAKGKLVGELASQKDVEAVTTQVYWAALSRQPSEPEATRAADFLRESTGNGGLAGGVSDLFWSLFCGPEFEYLR